MKNILAAFIFSLFLTSCSDTTDVIPEEDPVLITAFTGTLQCADDSPLANIAITITDENGLTQSTTTDGSGHYTFDNLLEVDYTMSFTDPANYSYTQAEYDAITQEMRDIVFAVRVGTNMDHLAYNLINYEDGLTTLDMVFMDKLKTGDLTMSEIDFPWRYVMTSELSSNASITDQIQFTYTPDLELDITGIFIGDVTGLSCQ